MSKKTLPFSLATLSLALTVDLVISFTMPTQAQAQQAIPGAQSGSFKISQTFKPPKRGAPSSTAGGATRSFCVTDKTPLTILIPSSNIGLTTDAHPTFYVYVPQTVARQAEFVLKDAKENDVYRTTLALGGAPGVVSLRLPETAPTLEVGKDYYWYFSMICQPSDRLNDVFAGAWIQRIKPDTNVVNKLKKATPRDRPTVNAEAGLWHDTLVSLAELRRANPNDKALASDWTNLLKSVGLTQIADKPLVSEQVLGSAKPEKPQTKPQTSSKPRLLRLPVRQPATGGSQ